MIVYIKLTIMKRKQFSQPIIQAKINISVHVIIRILSGCGQYGIGILDYCETETKNLFFGGKK
jgi:hypothetical protein